MDHKQLAQAVNICNFLYKLLPSVHPNGCSKLFKVTTVQSGHIKLTSPNGFYGYTESIEVRVVTLRCVSICALLSRPINAELTLLTAVLTPPPPLNE